ncbi:MAG TPA: GNAT family N-acetyltransferase [Phycisphaerales bacterium]|nr:GNAT family N-acetyltransferase [Phycisphaerales bacterium]
MSTIVRPAARADVPLILALIGELAAYEREPQAVEATEEMLDRQLFGPGFGRGPTAECVIGELDGRAQGFALYFTSFSTWRGRPGLYLEDLFVRPEARGRGLGGALFGRLARIALERGFGRMEWAVLDWNEPAIGFYRSLGAVPMSDWTVYRLTDTQLKDLVARECKPR